MGCRARRFIPSPTAAPMPARSRPRSTGSAIRRAHRQRLDRHFLPRQRHHGHTNLHRPEFDVVLPNLLAGPSLGDQPGRKRKSGRRQLQHRKCQHAAQFGQLGVQHPGRPADRFVRFGIGVLLRQKCVHRDREHEHPRRTGAVLRVLKRRHQKCSMHVSGSLVPGAPLERGL